MNIASRMSQIVPEEAFTVLARAQQLERAGKSIIHLEIGQPDFPTPDHIIQAGIEALKAKKTKYSPALGIYSLREALARHITERTGINTTIESIAVTPGCKPAIFTALAAIVELGDEVLYPDPGFVAYENLIRFFGGKAIPIPLLEEHNFTFDINVLRKQISRKTKAIILNYPGNPTGTLLSDKDIQEIASLIEGTNIWIITDEIYSRILFTHTPYKSIYSLDNMKDRTFIVDGFSKTYSMTGWRLGYLVFPPMLLDKIDTLLVNMVSCTATFTQEAGLAALLGKQDAVVSMVAEFKKRRDTIIKMLNAISGIHCQIPQGAFYAFCNIQAFKKTSEEIAMYLLDDAGVALLSGTAFGSYGEGYIRISYATSLKNLITAIEKMRISLAKLPL